MTAGGPDDYDALLREVEASLNPPARKPPAATPAAPGPADAQGRPGSDAVPATGKQVAPRAADERSPLAERLVGGAVAGAVAGGAVFVLFALLPFVSSLSGAAGAFLATFVVWVLRGR